MTPVNYLSTLAFDQEFLDQVRAVSPEVTVQQLTTSDPAAIPPDVWAEIEVLHTSSVFPPAGAAPRLKWIQLDTSGADHLRAEPVWASDTVITTLGGVGPVAMAEYVLFTVLGMAHRLPALIETRNSREWPTPADSAARFTPLPVSGTTMAVIGYGRIGQEIARLAATFGIDVIGVSRSGAASAGSTRYDGRAVAARPAGPMVHRLAPNDPVTVAAGAVALTTSDRLDEVLPLADWLVVVLPRTVETTGLLDSARLQRLKSGAVLINASRGGIVDEPALLAALREDRLGGAALDVFDAEPLPPSSPWWTEPKVFLTPHVGGLTPDYRAHVQHIVTANLARHLAGDALLNVVDRERGY